MPEPEAKILGHWYLSLASDGNVTRTIPVQARPLGGTNPEVFPWEGGVAFNYDDGRRFLWFAPNLLYAEYVPEPEEGVRIPREPGPDYLPRDLVSDPEAAIAILDHLGISWENDHWCAGSGSRRVVCGCG